MESKHLIYLSVILDKGSITAASEHLNIAQPTLTRAMATLEMQAGTQLFTRSRFGVSSTQIGETLAREGRAINRRLVSASEQVARYKLGIKENLRIAAGSLLSLEVMPQIIERMIEEHPDISLTVTCLAPTLAMDGLLDDQFDVVIAPRPSERSTLTLHRNLLIKDTIGIFCGQRHPFANNDNIVISDFKDQNWLNLGIASYFQNQTSEMLTSNGIDSTRTKIVFRNDAVMLMKLLSSGKFLAALPSFPASTVQKLYPIKEIKTNNIIPMERDLYVWCVGPLKEQAAFKSFDKIAHEVVGELKHALTPNAF